MLGNFSIGDYFKKEAIFWAWEFVTDYLKLPKKRLWATIYLDDDEAFAYWREVGVPAERILRFGEKDNFWGPVGDSGPCGPCSEIHYDLGEQFGCGSPECKPNCDCGRFSEIWNLVFTQYNQDQNGQRTPLSRPNIDTGMGLERTLAAIQGKPSPYETELFSPLVQCVCRLSGKRYGQDKNTDQAIRIVAEHSRGIAFLVADGVMPSNEGRGYVLRRILRRASVFGKKLGLDGPFLNRTTEVVIDTMSHVYPELTASRNLIGEVVRVEEGRFISTLDTGLNLVEALVSKSLTQGTKELAGEDVFRLYDTYGFPPELTAEIAGENGLSIDWAGFRFEMEKQRERARAGGAVVKPGPANIPAIAHGPEVITSTNFVGYEVLSSRSRVIKLAVKEKPVQTASQGDQVEVILDKTPFYGEMGGQVGDSGEISSSKGKVGITYAVRTPQDVIIHQGRVIEGNISFGDEVEARVDVARRWDVARNHTATHLLQAALRQILGSHVYQKGSLVEPERLRFDFSHLAPITEEQLREIQRQVNEWIRQNLKVEAKILPYKQAIAEGAIALFEEKYGEAVRVLQIGEPAVSKELCGGTHVSSTGEIGLILITSDSNIGTGLHRIEAVTGRQAEAVIESRLAALQSIAKQAGAPVDEVTNKVKLLVDELEAERKRALALERELSRRIAEDLLGQAEQVGGVTVLAARVPALSMPILRETGDILKDKLKSAIVVLAAVYGGKPSFLAMVTPDLIARGVHAGEIIKQVAEVTGGGGGGKPAIAQAGGKDATKIDEALKVVKSVIASRMS
jgi:alanyl-tRNA synthetase